MTNTREPSLVDIIMEIDSLHRPSAARRAIEREWEECASIDPFDPVRGLEIAAKMARYAKLSPEDWDAYIFAAARGAWMIVVAARGMSKWSAPDPVLAAVERAPIDDEPATATELEQRADALADLTRMSEELGGYSELATQDPIADRFDDPSEALLLRQRDGVFDPGMSAYERFDPDLHEIDGEIRAYLQGTTVIEFQCWTVWDRRKRNNDYLDNDYLLKDGYRHAVAVACENDAPAIVELLCDGHVGQWRELEAARVDGRTVQLVNLATENVL